MSPIIKMLLLTLSQLFGDQTKRNKTYSICVLNFPSWQNNSEVLFLKYFSLKGKKQLVVENPW